MDGTGVGRMGRREVSGDEEDTQREGSERGG
jgi:hypothetical protein